MERLIGERQRWAWIAAALSSVAAICLSRYSWPWVALGCVLVTGYYLYMDRRVPSEGLAVWSEKHMGIPGKLLLGVMLVWNVAAMAWAASLADAAFPMVDGFPVLSWVLLAVAAWGSVKGIGACARCSGVLCLLLLGLYGAVIVFAVPDIKWENLQVIGKPEDTIWCAGLFLPVAGIWYLPCQATRKTPAWGMGILIPAFSVMLSVITAGVLSPALAASRTVPFYDVAQSVSLFGVIERIEPLLSAAMTMGLFALLSIQVSVCQALAEAFKPWRYYGVLCCVVAGALLTIGRIMTVEILTAGGWLVWFGIPVITLVLRGKSRDNP